MKHWQPIFIEHSWIPVWLSYLAPIEIGAITLGFIVFARGELDERLRRHETIHFQQFLETWFVGFLLLYLWDFVREYARHKDGRIAYQNIRAEKEAYHFDIQEDYLQTRKRYQWIKGFEKEDRAIT